MPDPAITPRLKEHAPSLLTIVVGALLLLGLPVAVWLDLRGLSERILRTQAEETSRIVNDMRNFYASDVVEHILHSDKPVSVTHNYRNTENAIPVPATLSIELGHLISEHNGTVRYRFVSDFPFKGRAPHRLDAFEAGALAQLRAHPEDPVVEATGSMLDRRVRLASAVLMEQTCVACHNSHPDSPKRDWKVGDVRGIQEVSIHQGIEANIFAFKYLLLYFVFLSASGLLFLSFQRRQAAVIRVVNSELESANAFLSTLSERLSKYLSPQVYHSIFSGATQPTIATERKQMTVFFSDLKDFTAITERLQPEELTDVLNEYLTEMSSIALKHGATIDKFIGDAVMVFFGDPDSRGVEEDARACVAMALEMQHRLVQLNAQWARRGKEFAFEARMGIHSGYCNVGNFGSADRMDYTIIGAGANLAARLERIAEPGGIVISAETYALVRDVVRAKPLPAITVKGISRPIVPYAIEDAFGEAATPGVIKEHGVGVDIVIDFAAIGPAGVGDARRALQNALTALDENPQPTAAPGRSAQSGASAAAPEGSTSV